MRNFLKLTALVLALCMVLAVPVAAAENGTCGENVRWSYANGTLTISGTGPMADYDTYEYQPWYHLAEQITAVVLGEGVTTVGNMSLCYLPNVQTLQLPTTLEQIGVDPALLPTIFRATKDIRDKYVLSRLAWDLGILEELSALL